MTVRLQFYKCDICGNIVQILHEGEGNLVCCGQEMKLLEAKSDDSMAEKHVPKFFSDGELNYVQVGAVSHPMLEEHYIEFIQVVSDDKNYLFTKFLHANDEPKMFLIRPENLSKAYEYCNIHGLWEGERD